MRLINMDKYYEFLNNYPLEKAQNNFMGFYRDILQYIFECEVDPTTIVSTEPVVRCKDCKYWNKSFKCWYEGLQHYHCYNLDIYTDENFYCAEGKRREDAKE